METRIQVANEDTPDAAMRTVVFHDPFAGTPTQTEDAT